MRRTYAAISLIAICLSTGALSFAQEVVLTEVFKGSLCRAIRFKSQGQNTSTGFNYWRFEELILEQMGSSVQDPNALEVIHQFIADRYNECYCDKYQDFPSGGLLQQFVHANFPDGLEDFIRIGKIDIYSLTDKRGVLILDFIDRTLDGDPNHLISEGSKKYYRTTRSLLVDLAKEYPFEDDEEDWFDE